MLKVNRSTRQLDRGLLFLTWALLIAALYRTTLEQGSNQIVFWLASLLVAGIGAYHTVQELRQKPKFGFRNILDRAARRGLRKRLEALHLDVATYENAIEVDYGRIRWDDARKKLIALPPT